jgi:adenylyltransferase/sulfurtransferase
VEADGAPALRDPLLQLTPKEVEEALQADLPPFLLDVREPHEWEIGNLGAWGARLIPFAEVRGRIDELPKNQRIVVYCHVGVRSALIADTLRTQGFRSVANLKGGYLAWTHEVDPSLPRY